MVTEQKSPTTTTVIEAGWNNPTRAYASDNLRASCGLKTGFPTQEYSGYGFALGAGDTISQVKVQIEGYVFDPEQEYVELLYSDGVTWWGMIVPFTTSEGFYERDVTTDINTPAKLNAMKTRILYRWAAPGGGCFLPDSEFVGFDGSRLKMRKVADLRISDKLLGLDASAMGLMSQAAFRPAAVTDIIEHVGTWTIIRPYAWFPRKFLEETLKHAELAQLYNLRADTDILCDIAWTDNHPVLTRNRGVIKAGELTKNDALAELYYDNALQRFAVSPVPIEFIEKYTFEGTVYDLRGDSTWIFGRHLLGHMYKVPW